MTATLTPMKAIRARCLDCSGFSVKEVRECTHDECALHQYRFGHRPSQKAELTPMRAIRKHCLECCNGSSHEVKLCPAENCPLQAYRSGHRPKTNDYTETEVYLKNRKLQGGFSDSDGITEERGVV